MGGGTGTRPCHPPQFQRMHGHRDEASAGDHAGLSGSGKIRAAVGASDDPGRATGCPGVGETVSSTVPGCDRARHHRPPRCVPACRAGRPPRSAPPEHRYRRGDRAARRRRRPGGPPGGCAFPAAAPGPACSRGRLRAAILITAHARTGETRHPGSLLHIGHYGVARRVAADLALRDQGRLGGLPGLSPYVRAAPNPRALTGGFGASSHVLRSPLQAFLRFPVVCPAVLPLRPPSSGFPSAGVLWFLPFGRHCPVPFPFGFPPGSLPLEQP